MAEADRVDLAHEPDFALGRLMVSPVRRELTHEDGRREVIEHKVMQVLIALAKTGGAVVTRDELTRSCWEGRVVGEDAINRVISRLRKAADDIGQGSFRIETITKIGYRLVAPGQDAAPPAGLSAAIAVPGGARSSGSSRRMVTIGALATAGVIAAGGGAFLYRRRTDPVVPSDVADLVLQGRIAMNQETREGANQGIALFRRATEVAPDYADGWGMLGVAYAIAASARPEAEMGPMRERALAAARRAIELDPGNSYGELARIRSRALRGRWTEVEGRLRQLLGREPDNQFALGLFAIFMCDVGRYEDALDVYARMSERPITPNLYYRRIQALWGAGRIEELDRAMAQAAELYPTQFAIWFSRFYIALFQGKPDVAIALGEDVSNRPTGIPDSEFDDILQVARAARSRDPAAIEAAMATQMRRAREGSGKAENAAQFACLFGRVDMAFAIFDAYYFDRGFSVPAVRFTPSQGSFLTRENRMTRLLFTPSTKLMRDDPRFTRLTGELGLETYWRTSGVLPDYRRT